MARAGRPRVQDRLGDPLLGDKAEALRGEGRSWSEIGRELGVGRTTARRLALCQNSREASDIKIGAGKGRTDPTDQHPFQNDTTNVPQRPIEEAPAFEEPVSMKEVSEKEEGLPESFRLFEGLLRRADSGGQKRT